MIGPVQLRSIPDEEDLERWLIIKGGEGSPQDFPGAMVAAHGI